MSDNSVVVEDVPIELIDEEVRTGKKSNELNESTVSAAMSHHNMRYSIDPEQQMVADATEALEERIFDSDCKHDTT